MLSCNGYIKDTGRASIQRTHIKQPRAKSYPLVSQSTDPGNCETMTPAIPSNEHPNTHSGKDAESSAWFPKIQDLPPRLAVMLPMLRKSNALIQPVQTNSTAIIPADRQNRGLHSHPQRSRPRPDRHPCRPRAGDASSPRSGPHPRRGGTPSPSPPKEEHAAHRRPC